MDNFLTDWNWKRVLYLIGGIAFIIIAIKDQTWWMALFGIYFSAMAVFKLGCASGNCQVDLPKKETEKQK